LRWLEVKVLLIDVDSIWFNLALMKLSAWHKARGDSVYLCHLPKYWRNRFGLAVDLEVKTSMRLFDKAYVSCIFTENASKARAVACMLESMGIQTELGGSGVDLSKELPYEVEHICPDYSLYGLNYSVGFVTRGCIRRCEWCIVWRKEGDIRFHAPLKEFLRHKRLMLLDNNLLAYDGHYEVLRQLIDWKIETCFTQGLDIRLVDDENAKLLSLIRYRDTEFKHPRLYFSWDILNIEDSVVNGVETLKRHGIPTRHLLFYILCGFKVKPEDYTWDYFLENDWYRYERLVKLGCKPFIMKYNGRRDIPLLNEFARWVNRAQKARKSSLGDLESFKTFLMHERVRLLQSKGFKGYTTPCG
jgi:hypothetical protein